MSASTPRDRAAEPLSPGRIVDAAMELVGKGGLAGLSMRKLGARLGTDPMAVYYHVPNKTALFDLLVERVMTEIEMPPAPDSAPPRERLEGAARAFRRSLLAHGDIVELFVGRNLETPAQLVPVEWVLSTMMDAGLRPTQALWAVNALMDFVIGCVASEVTGRAEKARGKGTTTAADMLPEEEFPALRRVLDEVGISRYEDQFEFGLAALVGGILEGKDV